MQRGCLIEFYWLWQGFEKNIRAGDETQTRDPQLGRLMLYQLSYSRFYILILEVKMWGEQDSNLRRRTPADLQSAPVGRFGISPNNKI